MNFFFGIKNNLIFSELKIPIYQNNGNKGEGYFVYGAIPEKNNWSIKKINCDYDKNFFYIDFNYYHKNYIFFLAKQEEVKKYRDQNLSHLISFNNFTKTSPIEFRSNLSIYLKNKGFSSYQSEYPLNMCKAKGSIFSPLSILLNNDAEKNILFFRNIFYKPVTEKSKLYIVDLKGKKVIEKLFILSNHLNEINIKKEYIEKNYYIFTDKILGIPLFVSIKNGHLSFEHTHPPHLYLINEDRYKKVSELKQKIREIIKLKK